MITELQHLWLKTRGNRDINDVIFFNDEAFIEMRDHNDYVPILIPSDKGILCDFRLIMYDKKPRLMSKQKTA